MTMTTEEIVRDYRQARSKVKQIRILADRNLTTMAEIKRVLAAAGVEGVKAPALKRPAKAEQDVREESHAPEYGRIYDRIEAILAALPPDMSEATRREAGDLLLGLFADYLTVRLGEVDHGA